MSLRILILLNILILLTANVINGEKNVKSLQHYISTEKMEAEDYTAQAWTSISNDCPSPDLFYVGSFDTSSILAYGSVDFRTGVKRLLLHVANMNSATVDLAFHLADYNNPAFVTVPVNYTGTDQCGFTTLDVNLDPDVSLSGVQDLFLTFPSSTTLVLHLDWFYFNQTASGFVATDKIQVEDYTTLYPMTNVTNDCPDSSVYYIDSLSGYSTMEYAQVDFGSGVEMVTVSVANMYSSVQYIYLHLDRSTNSPIASISVGQTGSNDCDFYTLENFLDVKPTGVHDLYVTFTSPTGGWLCMDWFQFK